MIMTFLIYSFLIIIIAGTLASLGDDMCRISNPDDQREKRNSLTTRDEVRETLLDSLSPSLSDKLGQQHRQSSTPRK